MAVALSRAMESETNRRPAGARSAKQMDDDEDTLVVDNPGAFEDFDEFNGDNDATPDDRRRDPLRR